MSFTQPMNICSPKLRQSLTIKLVVALLNKKNITTYFDNLIVELNILYSLNTRKILCQSNIIYYLIYKFIFYT